MEEIVLKEIRYGSGEYEMTRELRNRIMRAPIGLSIYDQDYTFEVNSRMVGAFLGSNMLGCDDKMQKSGIGSLLLKDVEEWIRRQGAPVLILEARVTAQKFYEKHGYEAYGEIYLMEKSPVDHIMMRKYF